MEQFYRMTLENAIEHYKQGDLTAKGLLLIYLKIRIKPGWKLQETQKEICDKLGISRAAFYSAISKLKAEGSINWSAPQNTRFSFSLNGCTEDIDSQSRIVDSESMIVDSQSRIVDSESMIVDSQSRIVDKKPSKPARSKDSNDSPDYLLDSYQIFIKSLSDHERKSFLNFCQEESRKLPNPPTLVTRWIECHHEDLKAKWLNFCGKVDANSNHQSNKFGIWQNHPRLNEMWQSILKDGVTGYYVTNINDTTIRDFCKFAMSNDALMEELDNHNLEANNV